MHRDPEKPTFSLCARYHPSPHLCRFWGLPIGLYQYAAPIPNLTMPIPMAYKSNSWASLSGETTTDTAPPAHREPTTMMAPIENGPTPPTVAFFRRMNPDVRGHLVSTLAEFLGTFMFLFFGFLAAQTGNEKTDTLRPATQQPGLSLVQISYIAAVFGLSLAVNVWIFYRVSGGQFNPAVRGESVNNTCPS